MISMMILLHLNWYLQPFQSSNHNHSRKAQSWIIKRLPRFRKSSTQTDELQTTELDPAHTKCKQKHKKEEMNWTMVGQYLKGLTFLFEESQKQSSITEIKQHIRANFENKQYKHQDEMETILFYINLLERNDVKDAEKRLMVSLDDSNYILKELKSGYNSCDVYLDQNSKIRTRTIGSF